MKKYAGFLLVGIISAVLAVAITSTFMHTEPAVLIQESQPVQFTQSPSSKVSLSTDGFVEAAAVSTPAVVHIRTSTEMKNTRRNTNPFWEFFGEEYDIQPSPQQGSGSGVIISADGYIVTNNHVIDGADDISVTLHDNKEYKAELIGTDVTTDVAVIKIKEDNLSYLGFGNSDHVKIGQWVMAVGNPFNLSSTVTAGIVSAKARNINILREKAGNVAIESFIQTDAAVNPGNSGGALVDLKGNLVGINTAIATPTGTYAGYSFAVPANLVKKVVTDIMEFGLVQRGFMGVSISSLTSEMADELGIDDAQGVYISEIVPGSGASDAGLKPGDVITKINGSRVKSSPELQELVGRFRPGDKVDVELIRNKKIISESVELKTRDNSTELLAKKEKDVSASSPLYALGGTFETLPVEDARELGVRGGVVIKKIKGGILESNTQIKPGFVITKINNSPVESVEEFEDALLAYTGDGVLLEGRYPGQNSTKYYAFGM